MRIYSAASQENLRTRDLLKEWVAEGLLTHDQRELFNQDLVPDLSTTNLFLRIVLFFFTLIGIAAIAGLFDVAFLSHASGQLAGVIFLFFASACYAAAETAVSQARFYRHGIEEALAVSSIYLLFLGLDLALNPRSVKSHPFEFLIPATCAILALWIWHRFNLWYTFPAAMILVSLLPAYWTSSSIARPVITAVFYIGALIAVAVIRRRHRLSYLNSTYSLAEAFLWLGIYIALNLQLSATNLLMPWSRMPTRLTQEPASSFYWITWVLIWCLPPIILARGIRQKDRFVMEAGALTLLLTFITNKPYLGWTRHTWDPMLLGIVLTAASYYLRRWLAQGPDGIRHGFTASNLSARDKRHINTGSALLGFVTPQSLTPAPQHHNPDLKSGDGASGGAGASREF
ncbi:hypothetical protein [Granulicella tundricola]|uniref:DUF2157 domain-containing protein n=1 Tax=Granulicella tundricola (strain ATCC BAA-1859 / DSM 23138 / MP5ACTX9) TaxID=1198114 RepID=E8WXN6_GRATM|nr:hypothetical protein [Granulicella tundricola]ADW68652.1 hypothetical protein AciX9_1599 [Granulicella tundricola MP5ACTX9]